MSDDPVVNHTPSFAPHHRYDTFWPRLGAGIIDGILFVPLGWIDVWVYNSVSQPLVLVAWFVLYSFSFLIYSIVFHGIWGQTLGKMFTHVRVLDISETRLTFRQAILRDSVPLAFTAVGVAMGARLVFSGDHPSADPVLSTGEMLILFTGLAWFVAEIVTMLWNNKRRAVHDYIARSVVVRT